MFEFSAISSLVLTLRAPVRPTPKAPSAQQIIAGCQFWQPYILAKRCIIWTVTVLPGVKPPCPQARSLGSDLLHAPHDEVQRLIPTHAAPRIRVSILANLGVQQSPWIAKNLACGAAAPWLSGLSLSPLTVFSLPPSTSTNIPQNVG